MISKKDKELKLLERIFRKTEDRINLVKSHIENGCDAGAMDQAFLHDLLVDLKQQEFNLTIVEGHGNFPL